MWTDRYLYRSPIQSCKPLARNSQLGRRTSPKQIRRRRGDHQKVWIELVELLPNLFNCQLMQLSIDQQRFMSALFDLVKRKQQLQRVVWVLAPKINRSLKIPCRVD